ncbi:hypothetical protein B0H13DRAFT_2265052 [Mycena leptocephala]|nr:hypothetical protein B0H13DRAFT_2265052 [Mycena leptocephala]
MEVRRPSCKTSCKGKGGTTRRQKLTRIVVDSQVVRYRSEEDGVTDDDNNHNPEQNLRTFVSQDIETMWDERYQQGCPKKLSCGGHFRHGSTKTVVYNIIQAPIVKKPLEIMKEAQEGGSVYFEKYSLGIVVRALRLRRAQVVLTVSLVTQLAACLRKSDKYGIAVYGEKKEGRTEGFHRVGWLEGSRGKYAPTTEWYEATVCRPVIDQDSRFTFSDLTEEKWQVSDATRIIQQTQKSRTDQCNYDMKNHIASTSGKDIGSLEEFFEVSSRRNLPELAGNLKRDNTPMERLSRP